MTKQIKTAWDKTKGYKTVTGGTLLLLFDLFRLSFPHAMDGPWEEWTGRFINFIIYTGVLDKIWRNRKEISDWLKSKKDTLKQWVINLKKKKP